MQQDLNGEGRMKTEANTQNYRIEPSGKKWVRELQSQSVLSLCSKVANETALLKQCGLIATKSMSEVMLQGISVGGKNGFMLKYFVF